jgi:hypothetical protein
LHGCIVEFPAQQGNEASVRSGKRTTAQEGNAAIGLRKMQSCNRSELTGQQVRRVPIQIVACPVVAACRPRVASELRLQPDRRRCVLREQTPVANVTPQYRDRLVPSRRRSDTPAAAADVASPARNECPDTGVWVDACSFSPAFHDEATPRSPRRSAAMLPKVNRVPSLVVPPTRLRGWCGPHHGEIH